MGYEEPGMCIVSNTNKIILNRIKNIISDRCSKEMYNFKVEESGDKASIGEGKIQFIPHKRLTKYLDSTKKRWRNRNKARNMSPYVKYSFSGTGPEILSTVEYHVKEFNNKDHGKITIKIKILDKDKPNKNLRRYL